MLKETVYLAASLLYTVTAPLIYKVRVTGPLPFRVLPCKEGSGVMEETGGLQDSETLKD